MIDGAYGVDARNLCERCSTSGNTCRIYNPSVEGLDYKQQNTGHSLGTKCSGCRTGPTGARYGNCDASLVSIEQSGAVGIIRCFWIPVGADSFSGFMYKMAFKA
jgi:hypothetical protein